MVAKKKTKKKTKKTKKKTVKKQVVAKTPGKRGRPRKYPVEMPPVVEETGEAELPVRQKPVFPYRPPVLLYYGQEC